MRKLAVIFLLLILPAIAFSQGDPKFAYCNITEVNKLFSNKIQLAVDYGQAVNEFKDYLLRDAQGKPREFNSMVDALNYMDRQGWELSQTYTMRTVHDNVECHYVLKKNFDALSEAEKNVYLKEVK